MAQPGDVYRLAGQPADNLVNRCNGNRAHDRQSLFTGAISLWLWVTVLFANFAEALAEGRSKAQANSLKGVKKTAFARKLREPKYGAEMDHVPAEELRKGDIVLVEAGDIIPCDGEVIEGGASVDESAITGESAPVIRESGGDFASVTGGTRILSDWLVIECSVNPGETFLDRMIAMVEGAQRRKTPNEIALTILLIALTIVFYWQPPPCGRSLHGAAVQLASRCWLPCWCA